LGLIIHDDDDDDDDASGGVVMQGDTDHTSSHTRNG